MVCEIIEIEEDNSNGIYPLCACGCHRPIMKGDKVLQTNHGLFLLHDYDREDLEAFKTKISTPVRRM